MSKDINYDNEVPVKKNPDEGYSPDFIAANKKRLADLKAGQDAHRKKKKEP